MLRLILFLQRSRLIAVTIPATAAVMLMMMVMVVVVVVAAALLLVTVRVVDVVVRMVVVVVVLVRQQRGPCPHQLLHRYCHVVCITILGLTATTAIASSCCCPQLTAATAATVPGQQIGIR